MSTRDFTLQMTDTSHSLPGELSDPGRATTLALGERLRHLYVDQLKFMPSILSDTKSMYLRATPIQRALESVQQTFQGMYPPSARAPGFPIPDIVTRSANDETLFPNEGACKRFAELSQAFADRTAVRWNSSSEMAYLNKLIGKWMLADSPVVAVDSHPRLSGIMDTVNSTLAHGPETRLPSEFYDTKGREIINQIGVEEWFSGYTESAEYRAVGIGGLAGDIVARMVEHARNKPSRSGESSVGNGTDLRFALSGCHDTTLAALLTSLGAFDGEPWPPYTSHIAIELFRGPNSSSSSSSPTTNTTQPSSSWYSRLFGPATSILTPSSSSRTPLKELPSSDRTALSPYYVRLRYNDKIMTVPACKVPGNHFGDDESMCTLSAFKGVVDAFTPKNWKQACRSNLGTSAFPETEQRAGGMV